MSMRWYDYVCINHNPMSLRLGLSLLYSFSAKCSGFHLLIVPKYLLIVTHSSKYFAIWKHSGTW